jgi:hypothetical protein
VPKKRPSPKSRPAAASTAASKKKRGSTARKAAAPAKAGDGARQRAAKKTASPRRKGKKGGKKATAARESTGVGPAAAAVSDAAGELLREVADHILHIEAARARAVDLRKRLRKLSDPNAIPNLLKLLREGDPMGLRSEILLALERLPEKEYYDALLSRLSTLRRWAPDWAFVALLRVVNSRGGPNSPASRFEQIVRRSGDSAKRQVTRLLLEGAQALDPELRENVGQTIRALGGDPSPLTKVM